jgi:hypothetical protein
MKEAVVNKSEREREGSTICNSLILYASGSTISKQEVVVVRTYAATKILFSEGYELGWYFCY